MYAIRSYYDLQVRAVSIVRPSTDEEEEALLRELAGTADGAE